MKMTFRQLDLFMGRANERLRSMHRTEGGSGRGKPEL
jgi:hypothetical protein